MSVISTNGLTKNYGKNKGVFDATISVEEGEVFGFLGPNGAGKTTTIRLLMGFISADGGKAEIFGMDCSLYMKEIHKKIGYLPGEVVLYDGMTGNKYLDYMCQLKGITDFNRRKELIEFFELDGSSAIRKMSKGMKQKVALVNAFMGDNDVYILDEPSSGLDPLMQNKFTLLLQQEKAKGKTIFLSSHIFEEIEKTADRIAIIKQGVIIDMTTVSKMKQSKNKVYEVTFRSEKEQNDFLAENKGTIIGENKVRVEITGGADAFVKSIAKYYVENLEEEKRTLEDAFLHYYG